MKNLFIVAFLAFVPFVACLELKGDYSEVGVYKLFHIKRSLTLSCTADDIVDIVWYKDDEPVEKVDELDGRFSIDTDVDKAKKTVESEFTIAKTTADDSGKYSCRVLGDTDHDGDDDEEDDEVQEFMAVAQIVMKSPSDVEVTEGEDARINCIVLGYRPIVEWILPETANLSKISFENDTEIEGDQGNILVIEDTDRETDRADYICQAWSADEVVFESISKGEKLSSKSFLRVKDQYAFMYPLIGLVIVISLFTVIVVASEHHRKKLLAENGGEIEDEDQPAPQKKIPSKDVRQRK